MRAKHEVYVELAKTIKGIDDTVLGALLRNMIKDHQEDILAARRAQARQQGGKTDTSSEEEDSNL